MGSQEWQGLMRKTVTRCGIAALALSSAVLISYPSFPSTFAIIANPQLVNHALKGDRLPTTAPGSSRESGYDATFAREGRKAGARGLR